MHPVSFASRWIETEVSAEVVRTRWMSSSRGQQHVVVAGSERTPPRELDAAFLRIVELLVLIALVEADEPPRQVVVDRGHRPGRHDEAEQAERTVGGAEEEPLADAATHAAVGHVALELSRQPVATRQRLLEDGTDALAGIGGGRRVVDLLAHRGDELADERRVEHVLVGLERRQPVVVVQVAHDQRVEAWCGLGVRLGRFCTKERVRRGSR